MWLRGRKQSPDASGGGSTTAIGPVVATIITPSILDTPAPTPTSGAAYRPVAPPAAPAVFLPPPQPPQTSPDHPVMGPPVVTPQPVMPPRRVVRDPRVVETPQVVPPWDDGRPAFCGREWVPVELRECREGEPTPRTGTPPHGTLVAAYAPPWSRRWASQPSCPYSLGQGGLHVIEVGSPEWTQACGPMFATQES